MSYGRKRAAIKKAVKKTGHVLNTPVRKVKEHRQKKNK